MFDEISLFSDLSDTEKNNLAIFCQSRWLAPAEKLFDEGDDAFAMYIVQSGSLRAYRKRSAGDIVLGTIQSGELVGEMAVFNPLIPKKRLASVMALGEGASLLVILDSAIIELSEKHPPLYEKIMAIIRLRNEENLKKFAL